MNILIIGYCPQRFMNPVAERLKANGHKVDLTSFTHFDISKEEAAHYNSIHNGSTNNGFFIKGLDFLTGWVLYGSLMIKFLFRNNGFGLAQKSRWVLKALLNHHMTSQVRYYDLVNIQLLADYDAFYPFIKDHTKVVCSYWGSDLLQASNKDLVKQKKWLRRSDVITVQSDELETVLLQKHVDIELSSKVRKSLYPVNQDIFQTIIKHIDKREQRDKIIISIGYNASKNQNHLKILDQINDLPNSIKEQLHLYVHMSYGGIQDYIHAVEKKLKELGVDFEFNTRFLTDEEISMKRIESDVFIHLPNTDAFCAALSESFIANNIVITGEWLPYGLYDRHDVYMEKLSDISQLSERLIEIALNLSDKKQKIKANQKLVLDIVDKQKVVEVWHDIFESALST